MEISKRRIAASSVLLDLELGRRWFSQSLQFERALYGIARIVKQAWRSVVEEW
jgi:hypothetical protein